MDDKLVYLESDEEITGVIDKISKASSNEVALVVPRGASIAQSVVNLKLIKKRAADLNKDVSLVTTDKISRNLASQVGMSVYSRVEEVGRFRPTAPAPATLKPENIETIKSHVPAPEVKKPVEEIPEIPGVKINRYYDDGSNLPQAAKKESEATFEANDTAGESSPWKGQGVSQDEEAISKTESGSDFERRPMADGEMAEISHHENKIDSKEPPKIRHRQPAGRRFQPMRKRRAIFIFIALSVIIVTAFGYLVLPQAKVKLVFSAESFTQDYAVTFNTASTSVDSDNLILPATLLSQEKELSEEYVASGKKNIGNKASGKITFYNSWSDQAQTVTAGAALSAEGKKFIAKESVSIPGATLKSGQIVAGQITANIEAVESGESSNLSPTKFTIDALSGDQKTKIYGQSSSALTGGSTKEVTVVSEADLLSSLEKIKTRLITENKDELLKKIPSGDKYLEGAFREEFLELVPSAKVGDQIDKFTYRGKLKTTIISASEINLITVLSDRAESQLPKNRVLVQKDKATVSYALTTLDPSMASVAYTVTLNGKVSSQIDQGRLKKELAGKKIDQAKSIIGEFELLNSAEVVMQPKLKIYTTMPLFERSIKININYEISNDTGN